MVPDILHPSLNGLQCIVSDEQAACKPCQTRPNSNALPYNEPADDLHPLQAHLDHTLSLQGRVGRGHERHERNDWPRANVASHGPKPPAKGKTGRKRAQRAGAQQTRRSMGQNLKDQTAVTGERPNHHQSGWVRQGP